jgi:hypothetical protein
MENAVQRELFSLLTGKNTGKLAQFSARIWHYPRNIKQLAWFQPKSNRELSGAYQGSGPPDPNAQVSCRQKFIEQCGIGTRNGAARCKGRV